MLWLLPLAIAASPLKTAERLQSDGLPLAAEAVLLAAWRDGALAEPLQERALRLLLSQAEARDDLYAIDALRRAGVDLPEGLDALHYLRGMAAFEAGDHAAALTHLAQLSPASPLHRRARYTEGVILNQQDRLKSAVLAFSEVYRDEQAEPLLKDRSLLNIGWIYYKIDRFDEAHTYFRLVDRDSPVWPEAMLGAAWSLAMQDEAEDALGALLALRGPEQADTIFLPEVAHLAALLYTDRCHYNTAMTISLQLRDDLDPMRSELAAVGQMTPEQALERWFGEGDAGSALPVSLFAEMLRDRDLLRALNRADEITAELAHPDLDAEHHALLKHAGAEARQEAGVHLVEAARSRSAALHDLLQQSEILRFELIPNRDAQGCTIGRFLAQPEPDTLTFTCMLARDVTVWDFQGEFWADEVGYYSVALPDRCEGAHQRY